ncbi:MAG: hypothetical protein JSR18_16100 [Proteobacteria bacterium]|nr:hypothetical protein [Pseudomonadota bacterium]
MRAAREGVYWQARDGLRVQLAAGDHAAAGHAAVQRGVRALAGGDEASAPEGALAFLVRAPRVAEATRGRQGVGAAGLLMALWFRLFADTA